MDFQDKTLLDDMIEKCKGDHNLFSFLSNYKKLLERSVNQEFFLGETVYAFYPPKKYKASKGKLKLDETAIFGPAEIIKIHQDAVTGEPIFMIANFYDIIYSLKKRIKVEQQFLFRKKEEIEFYIKLKNKGSI